MGGGNSPAVCNDGTATKVVSVDQERDLVGEFSASGHGTVNNPAGRPLQRVGLDAYNCCDGKAGVVIVFFNLLESMF